MVENNQTLRMYRGDFTLLPPDENGAVRHALVDGDGAFGQRIANRLLAIKGECVFDVTIGLPLLDLSNMQSEALFASVAADATRNDDELQSLQNVTFVAQTVDQLNAGVRIVSMQAVRTRGGALPIQLVVS